MKEEHSNIVAKILSSEASEEEVESFFKEIETNNELEKEYNETKEIWNMLSSKKTSYNKERILKLITHKISMNRKRNKNKFLYSSLKYAAIFLGILVLSVAVFNDLQRIETIVNTSNNTKTIILPDNTVITLNSNSTIEYGNSNFKPFSRKVKLNGEAFFHVTKKENKKFIVQTNDYDVTVFGTKFNVRTFTNDNSVVLSEGKVILNNINQEVLLKPNEIATFNSETKTFSKEKINSEIYTSWVDKKINFNNLSLKELTKLFKIRYNKVLIINAENTKDKQLSGSAPSDDVSLIIKALESIYNSKILVKGDTIIIN